MEPHTGAPGREWRPEEEIGGSRSSAAPAGASGGQRDLAEVERVLEDIFDYYAPKRSEPRLTCARFKRICEDSRIIDRLLPSAKVDVTFAQVCRNSPHMLLPQFRDAIVRLAALKYPTLSRPAAVLRIYDESLSAFGNAADPVFDGLGVEVLEVITSAKQALHTLYKGYFATELLRPPQRSLAGAFGDAERGFVRLLADFEIVPNLTSGAVAHAVFRRVTETRRIPEHIEAALSFAGGLPGRTFTFAHFAVAMALAAVRCFADTGANALVRLFDWMEASKGRVVFAGAFPGLLPPGSALRLAPAPAAADGFSGLGASARGEAGTAGLPSRSWSAASLPGRPGEGELQESELGSTAASSFGSGADLAASLSRGSLVGTDGRRRSSASRGRLRLDLPAVSDHARRVVAQVFGHYASLGDPLNRSSLSSLKFNRFLRDCGLLSNDASDSFAFAPAARGSSGTAGDAMHRSSSSGGSRSSAELAERRRRLASIAEASSGGPRFAVSGGGHAALAGGALPLRVLPQPPLSKVDADLIFVQAVKSQEPEICGRIPVSSLGAKSGTAAPQRRGRNMTSDGFLRSLADVAGRCFVDTGSNPVEELCQLLLEPLLAAHGEAGLAGPGGLHDVVEFLLMPETEQLLLRCQPGVDRIFRAYAVDGGRLRSHWSPESLVRFAQDFEISEELSNLPLQRIFQDCLQYERFNGGAAVDRGGLSQAGVVLALALISQKVYMGSSSQGPMERLLALFGRINGIATLPALSARLGVQNEALLPVPRLRRSASNPAALQRRPGRCRELQGEMSWADLIASN